MSSSSLYARLRQFDAYSKPLEDFRIRTLSGGAVTLLSGVIMLWLFLAELRVYLSAEMIEELFVDSTQTDDKVDIHLDVLFKAIPCSLLTVDVMDVSGAHQSDMQQNVWKKRMNQFGQEIDDNAQRQVVNIATSSPSPEPGQSVAMDQTSTEPACGSCYGAETADFPCCNTCDDVREAYARRRWALTDVEHVVQCRTDSWVNSFDKQKNEGCRIYGTVAVAKVAGNLHIAPGETIKDRHSHVHDLHSLSPTKFNSSHEIRHLSFGQKYPNKQYPLDGHNALTSEGGVMVQYYIQVVPTMYEYLHQDKQFTYQYSVTKHEKIVVPGLTDGLPGFFVQYEFSPLMVKMQEREKTITHFLVSVCAIVGGVFTVASLFDLAIFHTTQALQHKLEIGKAS